MENWSTGKNFGKYESSAENEVEQERVCLFAKSCLFARACLFPRFCLFDRVVC